MVTGTIPLLSHFWARGSGREGMETEDRLAPLGTRRPCKLLCHWPRQYPSSPLKCSHCLRKEARSKGHEAAGSWPRIQSSELVLLRYHPAAATSCPLGVDRPQEHLLFLYPLPGHAETYFGFLTLGLPKVSLETGLSEGTAGHFTLCVCG